MKPNKFHLLLNSCDTSIAASINGNSICNESYVELLGITIDNELNFNKHVSGLCVQASKKLHALSRMSTYMYIDKRRIIMKSFFLSQFRLASPWLHIQLEIFKCGFNPHS